MRSALWFGLGITVGTILNFYVLVPLAVACAMTWGMGYVAGRSHKQPKKIACEPPNDLPSLMDADYYSGRGFNPRGD